MRKRAGKERHHLKTGFVEGGRGVHMQMPSEARGGIRSPGARVTDDSKPLDVGAEN